MIAQQPDQAAQRHRVEAIARLEQVHRDACRAKVGYQFALAAQHRGFEGERLPIGVGQQGQEVIFRAASLQRGDQLEDTNWPPVGRRIGLLSKDRLHVGQLYVRDYCPAAGAVSPSSW
jgi:hypothetical protein